MLVLQAATAVAVAISSVHGMKDFREKIPNGFNVAGSTGSAWAGVGHLSSDGGGTLNPFGKDFKSAGKTWTPELCRMDSDGDGVPNGVELGVYQARVPPSSSEMRDFFSCECQAFLSTITHLTLLHRIPNSK
jgi:hypothetical protein